MNKLINKKLSAKSLLGYLFMVVGCAFYAFSTVLFLAPNQIVAGGVTGLSVLINILNDNIPIGIISIVINIPILLLGLKYFGLPFVLKCLLTVTVLGLTTDLFDLFIPIMTQDKILASLYGGVCQGIGIGLFVRYKFSSGGTELFGRVIAKWTKLSNIPIFVGILDGIIVVFGAIITKSPDNMLYALIVVFVSTKVSEVILVGLEKAKLCIVISDKSEEIAKSLIENSPRGVTMLDSVGMYTHQEHKLLLTCVKNRQLMQVKEIVKNIDKHAFMIINDSFEVRGQGFKDIAGDM